MNKDFDHYINLFLKEVIEKTIEGQYLWCSKDIENIRESINFNGVLLGGIEKERSEAREKLRAKIENLAFKNYDQAKIERETESEFENIKNLDDRIKFIQERIIRGTKDLKTFDLTKSFAWYLNFIDQRYIPVQNFYRIEIQKREDDGELIVDLKIYFNNLNKIVSIDTNTHPLLFTLIILLKKEDRLTLEQKNYTTSYIRDLVFYI